MTWNLSQSITCSQWNDSQFYHLDCLKRMISKGDGDKCNTLLTLFWKRWLREYLPLLQEHQTWSKERRSLVPADIVLLVAWKSSADILRQESKSANQNWCTGQARGQTMFFARIFRLILINLWKGVYDIDLFQVFCSAPLCKYVLDCYILLPWITAMLVLFFWLSTRWRIGGVGRAFMWPQSATDVGRGGKETLFWPCVKNKTDHCIQKKGL